MFTVQACNLTPRCARESNDSGDVRIQKIVALIRECNYGIHDVSRFKGASELPRFNMPLELGIFMGCKAFGGKDHKAKKYLILEEQSYRYLDFMTDLRGQDIEAHNNDPQIAMRHVRNWIANTTKQRLPGVENLWEQYLLFCEQLPAICKEEDWTVENLLFNEYSSLVPLWLAKQRIIERQSIL